MEKDERIKLADENGKTIFMTKSEYLDLAHQKGWDVKIPQLEDSSYDCDVFGGDGVIIYTAFTISGTLFLKDGAMFSDDISAHEGIILGNHANTYDLTSDNGDIILGNNADTCSITARNVICGDNLHTNQCDISATDGFVVLGKNILIRDNDDFIVSATEEILYDDEPTT